MAETLARITADGRVEFINEQSARIEAVEPMNPQDAGYLARNLLASAVALSGPDTPKGGEIIGDGHLPVMKWIVGKSTITGEPMLILTVPSGTELTFAMSPGVAKELGAALAAYGEVAAPPGARSGMVH